MIVVKDWRTKTGTREFRSAGAIIRWLTQNNGRPEGLYLPRNPHGAYWFRQERGLDLTEEQYAQLLRVLKRYRSYVHYLTEVEPEWQKVDTIHWADNSVEELQRDKRGNERHITVKHPSGDLCF